MEKQYRVKKSKDIENIIKKKKFASNPYFTIYMNKQDETKHFRYAMSVGKKIGNAVVRNRLKRQIRAIIRQCNIVDNIEIFIIARNKLLNIDFEEMSKQMAQLLQKLKLIKKGENDGSIFK